MKKFFMMFAVAMMTLVAATTMVSCGSDDSKKEDYDVYSLKTSITINDPENELTMQQKTDLQTTISLIGTINRPYTTDYDGLNQEQIAWRKKADEKIKQYINNNPAVRKTKAGVTLTYVGGNDTTRDIINFATYGL